ncbi:MAG: CPBP family intramembrane glutamic endopeptidase [Actinomycetota bacterium]
MLKTKIEIGIVLALSLGASAVYSLISLIAKLSAPEGLASSTTTINRQLAEREWLDFSYQFLGIVFGLAPVALVLYLLWRDGGSPFKLIGFDFAKPSQDFIRGVLLAASIGIPGLGLYVASRVLGLSSQVIPADLASYWWTIPILLLAAAKAAALEEVVVVGYLFKRLSELGLGSWSQIIFSALLRASYHLYQGFGGFLGNLVMGAVFGWLYQRWGRVMPLVFAHFLLDAAIFVGYAAVGHLLPLP